MNRSRFTLDVGAVRTNARMLARTLGSAELWAVVKADGYGHGAADVARAALEGGATALCVASVAEALELRTVLPVARIIVLGPAADDELRLAVAANLELVAADGRVPEGVPVHLKLDTGMGRWGLSELAAAARNVVGLMSHLASSEGDPAFTKLQIARFREATVGLEGLTRHLANSAAALAYPESRFDSARCGIALYGISPWGADASARGLVPAMRWESQLALVKQLASGESTGYGRMFVADKPTWIGIVPVGYADGFRRDLTGTEVLVGGERCRVAGVVSMDAFAVELPRKLAVGEPVSILGGGVSAEEHAKVAGTIAYEIVTGLRTREPRARRVVVDGG
jgi:alanine racemase